MKKLIITFALTLMLAESSFADAEFLLTRVSLDQATHQLIQQNNLRVLSAYTTIIDGKEIHVIKVLTPDGHIRHYRIDAETGNPVN